MTFTKAPSQQVWDLVRLADERDPRRFERHRFRRRCSAAARDDGPGKRDVGKAGLPGAALALVVCPLQ
jgi:hypothetical protein